MPLEVLIATPSGPFGELIRLSLEADPEFHCALIDKSADIREAVQKTRYQAVIFDCSFTQPEPGEIVQLVRDEVPSAAVLLVQPENRPDISPIQNIQIEGWITRPFDASVLPEKVRAAIKKERRHRFLSTSFHPLRNRLPGGIHFNPVLKKPPRQMV